MADTKITALTAITTVDPAADVLPIVDVSDTSMAASGTTKKITSNQILGAGGTATLASATISGDLTVDTSTLKVDSANNRVGIGTATPSSALEVVGAASISGNTTSSGFIVSGASSVSGAGMWGLASALAFNVNSTEGMRLTSTGLGVGVSPGYPLHVQRSNAGPTAWIANSTTYAQLKMVSSGTNQPVYVTLNPTGTGAAIFQISDVDRLTIDSSGNVGIGVTPSAWSTSASRKAIQLSTAGSISAQDTGTAPYTFVASNWVSTATGDQYILGSAAPATLYRQFNGIHSWFNAPSGTGALTFTQAMTLDASGNLSVGATSPLNSVRIFAERSGGSVAGFNRTTSDGTNVLFYRQGSIVGDVSVTTTGTTFNSTSDYRLKEAVQPLVGGLARVSALKPSIYKWKSNGSSGEGFLAHELAEVVPAAVSGEKDAVNEDGSIKAQSIDMSRVVPILVAAIQELAARVQTLETR